jgi:CheY-like chemotaxis protein/two-component sensor histidine kinase
MTASPARLLIVEDSPEDREAYRRLLAAHYELVESDSAEEALRLCRAEPPACILIDYSLGDRDAIEFLQELKGDGIGFPAAVVVVTGQGNERIAVQAMKLGVEDYVVKDDLARLPGVVRAAIARHSERQQRAYRILIVDDSLEDREFYKRRLPERGAMRFEFEEAGTAAEGLRILSAWSPDCVLLDYGLPDADGLSLLSEIRRADAGAGVAVVVLTGQGSEAIAVAALKAGAQDYVVKSSAVEMLRQAVIGAVEKVRLDRRLEEQRRALERSEAALRETARRKDEFLAMLAHELRNPLAPLSNLADILRARRDDPESIDFVREVLERQVGHMGRLVEDLLEVSRVTRGLVMLKRSAVDLRRLVAEVLEDHRSGIERAGLHASLAAPEAAVWVDADATRLAQVLSNVLANAVKFTPRGGRIDASLDVDREGRSARIAVQDTGAGIDPAILGRLFEVFEQGDHSLHRPEGGLGLGLAIAKGLVELHGGTIRAESEGPGKGARFSIDLPLGTEPVALREPARQRSTPRQGGRILIVDDNVDAALTLRIFMQIENYEVRVAYNGIDAVRMAREEPPDAILCDIGLPGMNGFEVAKALRRDPGMRRARLIAITGYGSVRDREHALASGFDDHLVKPVDPAVLLETLHSEPLAGS